MSSTANSYHSEDVQMFSQINLSFSICLLLLFLTISRTCVGRQLSSRRFTDSIPVSTALALLISGLQLNY